ncbi:hypothetical protein [Micromonospora sp. WMMD812]|uniref:hypothetical protein n=1 Tax=Micromonospora sp. WMMD812 TaxID=3015152 RepID=UPI00248B7692|nr:hypothetical protein [Micromonospora sp. WMMD812]WBB65369.1 hypothetical protein O7603_19385 [Micromonospora sp. WMMD812]
MVADLASGLRFAAQPVVSVFVPGTPAVSPNFDFGGMAPVEVQRYPLERDDPDSFPYSRVTEYDLVLDELPADLHAYLIHCVRCGRQRGLARIRGLAPLRPHPHRRDRAADLRRVRAWHRAGRGPGPGDSQDAGLAVTDQFIPEPASQPSRPHPAMD